jgi:hypothetical protein
MRLKFDTDYLEGFPLRRLPKLCIRIIALVWLFIYPGAVLVIFGVNGFRDGTFKKEELKNAFACAFGQWYTEKNEWTFVPLDEAKK